MSKLSEFYIWSISLFSYLPTESTIESATATAAKYKDIVESLLCGSTITCKYENDRQFY